jgi:hypothetical protein
MGYWLDALKDTTRWAAVPRSALGRRLPSEAEQQLPPWLPAKSLRSARSRDEGCLSNSLPVGRPAPPAPAVLRRRTKDRQTDSRAVRACGSPWRFLPDRANRRDTGERREIWQRILSIPAQLGGSPPFWQYPRIIAKNLRMRWLHPVANLSSASSCFVCPITIRISPAASTVSAGGLKAMAPAAFLIATMMIPNS